MKATLEQILNPGKSILAAWVDVLKVAVSNTYSTFGDEERKTPFAETHVAAIQCTGHARQCLDWKVYDAWNVKLTTRVGTLRGANGDDHEKIVEHVLVNAGVYWKSIGQARLPFHKVTNMMLSGYSTSVESGGDHDLIADLTDLTHDLHMEVRDVEIIE